MNIKTFVFAFNDEKIIPYTMRHYTKFSSVVIVDNGSTDRTVEMAVDGGAKGMRYSQMRDELDDIKLAEMKSTYWQGIDADWCIICDADEFIWHPDLLGVLARTKATIIEPRWGEMFAKNFPSTSGQIYDEVKTGVIGGGFKNNIFKPKEITEINYGVGCHSCVPKGNVIYDDETGIMTLHMKNLSKQLLLDKAEQGRKRLSETNIKNGFSSQFLKTPEEISGYFDTYLALSKQIIP